eukprot:4180914-Amphidinium_carterae.1
MRDYLERALHILEAHYDYGPDHPEVAKHLAALGTAYGALGDAFRKRDYLERALRIFEVHYGSEHPQVLKTLVSLGNRTIDCLDWPDLTSETKHRLQQQGRDFKQSNAGNPKLANVVRRKLQKARDQRNREDQYKYSWVLWASHETIP